MGTFNRLHADLTCPRCGAVGAVEIEVRFGNTAQMQVLRIGDRYPWVDGRPPEQGGRPVSGSVDGDGYMECERCRRDAFLRIIVRDDVIVGVEPDPETPGYIPDCDA